MSAGLPYATVSVGKSVFSFLADTGAALSCISEETFNQIKHVKGLKASAVPPDLTLRGANGARLATTHVARFNITLGGKTFQHDFIVIKGLSSEGILGNDFVAKKKFMLKGDGERTKFSLADEAKTPTNEHPATIKQETKIPPRTIRKVPITIANIHSATSKEWHLFGDHDKVEVLDICINESTTINPFAIIANHASETMILDRGEKIGHCEPFDQDKVSQHVTGDKSSLDINAIMCLQPHLTTETRASLFDFIFAIDNNPHADIYQLAVDPSKEKYNTSSCRNEEERWERIKRQINLKHVPISKRPAYWDIIKKNMGVFSINKFELGRTNAFQHDIRMNTRMPLHRKQFRIPIQNEQHIHEYVDQLLASGCIELSKSPYNSPIFVVQKKDGSPRIVLDYRHINAHSLPDKYLIRDVRDCLDNIGKQGSSVFSTMDITSSFWQLPLNQEARPISAFTVPGRGRFQWTTTPMGLHGSTSSFARLIDLVLTGITNTVSYIDDIICHNRTHEDHVRTLGEVFKRLMKYNLKLNPSKCEFGASQVDYLGYTISGNGIQPGTDKTDALRMFPEPNSVKKVRQFIGLANYFRQLIPNFSAIASPLTQLTGKQNVYKQGELPDDAKRAFHFIRDKLTSRPVLKFPDYNKEFFLWTDAAKGDGTEAKGSGLGAVLMQIGNNNKYHPIAYISRSLRDHEKNYSSIMLETLCAQWAIEYLHPYLHGKRFTLITDCKPMKTITEGQTRTLNRLQQLMLQYQFNIVNVKGEANSVADALSRNPIKDAKSIGNDKILLTGQALAINNISPIMEIPTVPETIQQRQRENKELANLKHLIINGDHDGMTKTWQRKTFIDTDMDIIRIDLLEKKPAVLPNDAPELTNIIDYAHKRLAGHFSTLRTVDIITKSLWWPNIEKDVANAIGKCNECQLGKTNAPPKAPLQPLEQPQGPNQRVHIDLLGPLKTHDGSKYILVMTCAFSKYTRTIPIDDKSAETVASAMLKHWIVPYSPPMAWCSDQGKEFINQTIKKINALMGTDHLTTSAYHPQTNGAAERFNSTICNFMRTRISDTLNWEDQLPALELIYNSTIHSTTKMPPMALFLAFRPKEIDGNIQKPPHPNSKTTEFFNWMNKFKTAFEAGEKEKERQKAEFDKHAKEREFEVGESVMLRNNIIRPNINNKFSPKFKGPYFITRKISDKLVEIQESPLHKPIKTSTDRLVPYFFNENARFFDDFEPPMDETTQPETEKEELEYPTTVSYDPPQPKTYAQAVATPPVSPPTPMPTPPPIPPTTQPRPPPKPTTRSTVDDYRPRSRPITRAVMKEIQRQLDKIPGFTNQRNIAEQQRSQSWLRQYFRPLPNPPPPPSPTNASVRKQIFPKIPTTTPTASAPSTTRPRSLSRSARNPQHPMTTRSSKTPTIISSPLHRTRPTTSSSSSTQLRTATFRTNAQRSSRSRTATTSERNPEQPQVDSKNLENQDSSSTRPQKGHVRFK